MELLVKCGGGSVFSSPSPHTFHFQSTENLWLQERKYRKLVIALLSLLHSLNDLHIGEIGGKNWTCVVQHFLNTFFLASLSLEWVPSCFLQTGNRQTFSLGVKFKSGGLLWSLSKAIDHMHSTFQSYLQ